MIPGIRGAPPPLRTITLYLTYTPLSFFRFQLYASVTRDNPWGQMFGQPDPSDEEQDTVKVSC